MMALFIVSRFNLYIPHFREMAGLTDENYLEWCRERVALFRKYTLPSVNAQEFLGYKWVIAFDTELNEPVVDLLEEVKGIRRIHPFFYNNRPGVSAQNFVRTLNDFILNLCNDDVDHIVTTRLDTDDLISRQFLGVLHSSCTKIVRECPDFDNFGLNFPFGVQYYKERMFVFMYEYSPFISVMSKRHGKNAFQNAFSFAHYDVGQHMKVKQIITPAPMWVQLIHDLNAANTLKEGRPELCNPQELLRDFSLYFTDSISC